MSGDFVSYDFIRMHRVQSVKEHQAFGDLSCLRAVEGFTIR